MKMIIYCFNFIILVIMANGGLFICDVTVNWLVDFIVCTLKHAKIKAA